MRLCQVCGMCHPIKEMIGASPLLAGGCTLYSCEGVHKRRYVPGPSRGCIHIYPFHVTLSTILVKSKAEGAFSYGSMKGGVPDAPLPCSTGRERGVNVRVTMVCGEALLFAHRGRSCYSIGHVNSPVVFSPGVLGFGAFRVRRDLVQ